MQAKYRIEKLRREHSRALFSSGDPELDRWFHQYAYQNMKRGVSVVYVLIDKIQPLEVIGFYTLSAATIELGHVPAEWIKLYPKYPLVPVALLGRLGISMTIQGQGIGSALVADGLKRAERLQADIGLAGVLVQSKTVHLIPFYERLGFRRLGQSLDLFIPMQQVRQSITIEIESDK